MLDGLSDFFPSLLPVFDIIQLTFLPSAVPVLHPSILFLTNLRRWEMDVESTRLKTKEKIAADAADMDWDDHLAGQQ